MATNENPLEEVEEVPINPGSGVIKRIGAIDATIDQLFREFIDNSTSSFEEHKSELSQICHNCIVNITWSKDEIIIIDNAFGMNKEEFKRAMKLNAPAQTYTDVSRGKYGFGLKYAAAAFGDWYQIESIEFNTGKKYRAEFDIDYMAENNPENGQLKTSYVDEINHGTKITIRKLKKFLTTNTSVKISEENYSIDQIADCLSFIYSKDLKTGKLQISINGTAVIYKKPEFRQNTNGVLYYTQFENSFIYNNKKYEYTGWAGILKKANTSGLGFSLMQHDRALQIHYHPTELFGKGNDYRFQRVIGEINLIGDNWIPSFTKNAILWDSIEMQEKFILSLKEIDKLSYIYSEAKKLRKDPPTPEQLLGGKKKPTKKDDSKTEGNKTDDTKTGVQNPSSPDGSNTVYPNPGNKTEPVVEETPKSETKVFTYNYEFNNKTYSFDIDTSQTEDDANWISLEEKNKEKLEYVLKINLKSKFLAKFTNKDAQTIILQFAVILAVSQLESESAGLKLDSSNIFINKINEIMKTKNPDK